MLVIHSSSQLEITIFSNCILWQTTEAVAQLGEFASSKEQLPRLASLPEQLVLVNPGKITGSPTDIALPVSPIAPEKQIFSFR